VAKLTFELVFQATQGARQTRQERLHEVFKKQLIEGAGLGQINRAVAPISRVAVGHHTAQSCVQAKHRARPELYKASQA